MPKKKSSKPAADKTRHVRIPIHLLNGLEVLAERNGRPMTWELKILIEKHLKENGVWPPPAPP
jgi:predicted DNA-binding protein